MTLTPNSRVRVTVRVRVRVRVRVGKVRKPYQNFQMVLLSMTLSDLRPTFQGHDNNSTSNNSSNSKSCMICPLVPFLVPSSDP